MLEISALSFFPTGSVCKRTLDTVAAEMTGEGVLFCKNHIPKDKPQGNADS
jgi:hypothetical protein